MINIEQLKELVELAAMLNVGEPQKSTAIQNDMIGKTVIVRARNAGVHMGELVSLGEFIELKNSHRVWKWEGAFTLSEVSQNGIAGGRIGCSIPSILIPSSDVGEVIGVADKAAQTIKDHVE